MCVWGGELSDSLVEEAKTEEVEGIVQGNKGVGVIDGAVEEASSGDDNDSATHETNKAESIALMEDSQSML